MTDLYGCGDSLALIKKFAWGAWGWISKATRKSLSQKHPSPASGITCILWGVRLSILTSWKASGTLSAPEEVHDAIRSLPGVVDTGFFFDFADLVIVGYSNGRTNILY